MQIFSNIVVFPNESYAKEGPARYYYYKLNIAR